MSVSLLQNSTLDFCVESFIPESDLLRVPVYDADLEKFKTTFRCIFIDAELLENFDSQDFLRKHGFSVPWDVLETMFINLTVSTITYRQMGPLVGKGFESQL